MVSQEARALRQTSATGANKRHPFVERESGFSLIEMLVVVFIIALASTVVLLNLPSSQGQSLKDADQIKRDLQRAHYESIASGELIGFVAHRFGYQFLSYSDRQWIARSNLREIDKDARSNLERTNLVVNALETEADDREEDDSNPELKPDIIFFPVGEATGAALTLQSPGGDIRILVAEDAEITIDVPE